MSKLTYQEWLELRFSPIMGGETPPATDDSTEDHSTDDVPDETEGDTPAGGESEAHEEESVDDADVDELDRIRRERDEARTRLANAEAAARKAKADARKAREEAAKKGGNWEAVAREREAELQELNERAQAAETRAVSSEQELDSFRREVRVTRLASLLGFHDPQDAMAQLRDQPETTADDKSCVRALRKLSADKPYLVDMRKARGRALTGENGQPGLTWEQIQAMTPEQINSRWAEVQPVLERGPSG